MREEQLSDWKQPGHRRRQKDHEVAGFTNALTDMEYLDLVQPYLDKAEIGMFLNAKRFREPNVELAASKGMKFLR